MKSKLFLVAAIAICRTKCDLKMKQMYYTATLVLALAFCASGLHAQDINTTLPGTVTTSYSSQIVSDDSPAASVFYGETVGLPVWNLDVDWFFTAQDSQEYLQIGYDGTVDSIANLKNSISKAPQQSDTLPACINLTGKRQATAPETVIPINATAADKHYTVAINPKLLKLTKSVVAETDSIPKSDSAQSVFKSLPLPNTTNIVYTTPKDQWVDLKAEIMDPNKHFEWDGLLTDNKLSMSRQNFTAYLSNSLNSQLDSQGDYDYSLPVQGNSFMMFAPRLISYDTSVPGEETFTTIFTFPVTDAMVVYLPDAVDENGNLIKQAYWQSLDTYGFRTQSVEPNLSNAPAKVYPFGYVSKIIASVDPDASLLPVPLLQTEPDFGAHDSYQNTGKAVTLSMSTMGLQPGSYTRYILWRRGYNADDGTIKPVGYIFDHNAADAYAVVDDIEVTQYVPFPDDETGVKNVNADNAVNIFSDAPHQVTIAGADGFAGGDATLYDLNGKTICTAKITGATQTMETAFQGFGIVKLQNGDKVQSHKVVVK